MVPTLSSECKCIFDSKEVRAHTPGPLAFSRLRSSFPLRPCHLLQSAEKYRFLIWSLLDPLPRVLFSLSPDAPESGCSTLRRLYLLVAMSMLCLS